MVREQHPARHVKPHIEVIVAEWPHPIHVMVGLPGSNPTTPSDHCMSYQFRLEDRAFLDR